MFEFFAGIKHFQKHKQHTSKDAEFIAVHDTLLQPDQMLQYIKRQDSATSHEQPDSNATIHQTTRQVSATVCRHEQTA